MVTPLKVFDQVQWFDMPMFDGSYAAIEAHDITNDTFFQHQRTLA